MSKPKRAEAVKLITSILSGDKELLNKALEVLAGQYGRVDFISAFLSFNYTDYYAKEMGSTIWRRFASFESLVRPELLPDIKLWTNGIEDRLSANGKRRVNIDPGYISYAHLILATGKGYTHRPYLRDGIYADLTLLYRDKTFHSLPWTYPDYAEADVIEMFNKIRAKYIGQMKETACDVPVG
ncbi:MAG: DUF4416 family protein [Syntrophales bacterium]|nr:DUF4416 family protein [Syntrophales bacterium]